jgi:hypothetical protein
MPNVILLSGILSNFVILSAVMLSVVMPWPYLQTLDWAGKASEKHSQLLKTFLNYDLKKFYNMDTWFQESKPFFSFFFFELCSIEYRWICCQMFKSDVK